MKKLSILFFTLFTYCNVNSQWIILNSPATVNLNSVYFVNSSTGFIAGDNGSMYKTTNAGINWTVSNTGLITDINSVCFINSNTGVACGNSGKIIYTSNSGNTWINIPGGVEEHLFAVSFYNNYGICSGNSGTLMYSTNGGFNWSISETGFLVTYLGAYMYSQSIGYACGVNTIFAPFLAKTTNGGMNWNFSSFYINNSEGDLKDIHFISDNEGFAVSFAFIGGGISRTTNAGVNWTSQVFSNLISCIDFSGMNTGYAAGQNGFILKSTDRGISWISQNSSTVNHLNDLDFTDSVTGYAVGDGGIILKTTNGGITHISESENNVLKGYTLKQNYPNPYNPLTKIKFDIPKASSVELLIFDGSGRKICELLNKEFTGGSHEIEFDGSDLSSGVYYYKLTAGNFTDTKRMVIIK